MGKMTVTISGFTDSDIDYDPPDKIIKPDDEVDFTKQNLDNYDVTISWDSSCPMTNSASVDLDGSNFQPGKRDVDPNVTNDTYRFTVTFEAIVAPGTQEEPEEPGPSHGGLEVSRDN